MTRDYGKLHVKAAGVRKITSRRSAQIELLNHAVLHLYKGRVFLVLTEVKMLDDFAQVKLDFDKVGLAYHLCELIDGLCPEDQDNPNVFFLLQKTLARLAQSKEALFPVPQVEQPAISDYTLGTYGISMQDAPRLASSSAPVQSELLHKFEIALLSELGYWNRNDAMSKNFDTHAMIETILERKLKSRNIFAKLQ